MRILDKYVTKEFLKYYFIFVLLFISIFVLTDFFGSIGTFRQDANIFQIITYYLLQIPYLFVMLSSIAIIISTLFTISYLGSTNQLQAMQVSGVSTKRIILPLFGAGLIIGFSILFLDNTLVYKANQMAHEIKQNNFTEVLEAKVQKNVFVAVPPDYLFYIRYLDVEAGSMEDVLIYKHSAPRSFISAAKNTWQEKLWILEEGREYILNHEPRENSFERKVLAIEKEPRYFTRTYFPPEKMSIFELTQYIDEYDKSGFATEDLRTELQFKVSAPFANFILMLVTLPLGIMLKRGRGANLAVGLLMSFGYYQTMALFKTIGKSGFMAPFFAAWMPTALFIVVGAYLIYKME